MSTTSPSSGEGPTGTLARGLAILELLATGQRLSASEVIARLDLSRSAVYRILGTLAEHGLVEWNTSSGVIYPGPKAIMLGMAGLAQVDVVHHGRAIMEELAARVGEACLMALVDGDEIVYVAHEDPSIHTVGVRRLLGTRRPIYATSLGKAFMSALPAELSDAWIERLDLFPLTDRTITDPTALRLEIAATRERGYAIDDGENDPGVMCLGAAIRDDSGRPVTSMSLAGPRERIAARQQELSELVCEAAAAISQRLGYLPPQPDGKLSRPQEG